MLPGWPARPAADFRETDIQGRTVIELSTEDFTLDIGGFLAHDYFGDGSFYIIHAPGHMIGHLNTLARTSAETFIFMAADSVHLGGEIRPSEMMHLPELVNETGLQPCPCPRETLLNIHPRGSSTLPYLGLDPSFPESFTAANNTMEKIQRFDADERVFVVFAHDVSIYETMDYFPDLANDWKAKGWKKQGRWKFLACLQQIARARQTNLP